MKYFLYSQANGSLAVFTPVSSNEQTDEEIVKMLGLVEGNYKIVDSVDLDNDYFNAYKFHQEKGAEVNIEKAKALHLNKWREARSPKLAFLDIAYTRADEAGDVSKKSEIADHKQALRDVTKTTLPNTLEEIKATWPSILS
jgi:hypothetical protein